MIGLNEIAFENFEPFSVVTLVKANPLANSFSKSSEHTEYTPLHLLTVFGKLPVRRNNLFLQKVQEIGLNLNFDYRLNRKI